MVSVVLPPGITIPNATAAAAAQYTADDLSTSILATNVDAKAMPPPAKRMSFGSPMIEVSLGRAIVDAIASSARGNSSSSSPVVINVSIPIFELRKIPNVLSALQQAWEVYNFTISRPRSGSQTQSARRMARRMSRFLLQVASSNDTAAFDYNLLDLFDINGMPLPNLAVGINWRFQCFVFNETSSEWETKVISPSTLSLPNP